MLPICIEIDLVGVIVDLSSSIISIAYQDEMGSTQGLVFPITQVRVDLKFIHQDLKVLCIDLLLSPYMSLGLQKNKHYTSTSSILKIDLESKNIIKLRVVAHRA
jgi:hypothetical protein